MDIKKIDLSKAISKKSFSKGVANKKVDRKNMLIPRIPEYPAFVPIHKEHRSEIHPVLSELQSGISEFSFAGLFLFREKYNYEVAWLPERKLIIRSQSGGQANVPPNGESFFYLPNGFPQDTALRREILRSAHYIKNLSEYHASDLREWFEEQQYDVSEDRDNFDYVYLRSDLAELKGRKYHKKRNLVNAFTHSYSYEGRVMDSSNIDDARLILNTWLTQRDEKDDYDAALEALDLKDFLELGGYIMYVDGSPVAYTMSETTLKGSMCIIQFEKAVNGFKGIYQFLNKEYALQLPDSLRYINREQDLGNEGLRQAKMTYRPTGFVKKFRITAQEALPLSQAPKPELAVCCGS